MKLNMNICKRQQASTKSSGIYTTRDDFCKIFTQDMKSLYLLSFLLTADHKRAEQCFTAGIEDCLEGNPVFKEWAHTWSRRAIIKNAIRIVSPLSSRTAASRSAFDAVEWETDLRPELAAVMQLEPLERFVYVMSILEHYSDQECVALLTSTREQIIGARTRALQRLSTLDVASIGPRDLSAHFLISTTS
jgi:hypothetical protein